MIMISEHGLIDRLIQSMCYINKVISASFIRDWCLKTCRHLKCSAHHFNQTFFDKKSKVIGGGRVRVYARHVLETMYLDEREFLCMMCNAFDR